MSAPRVSDELLAKVVVDRGGGTYPSEIANISPVTWALDLRDARERIEKLEAKLEQAERERDEALDALKCDKHDDATWRRDLAAAQARERELRECIRQCAEPYSQKCGCCDDGCKCRDDNDGRDPVYCPVHNMKRFAAQVAAEGDK